MAGCCLQACIGRTVATGQSESWQNLRVRASRTFGRVVVLKKRALIIAAVMSLVAIALVVACWPGEREPEYQGKKLSEWLEDWLPAPAGASFGSAGFREWATRRQNAQAAIVSMSSNAV